MGDFIEVDLKAQWKIVQNNKDEAIKSLQSNGHNT